MEPDRPTVVTLLDRVFQLSGPDAPARLGKAEIRQRTAGMDLPGPLRAVVDALPEGEYDRDEAEATMRRIQREEGMWRDEDRLPQADLDRAMATYAADGQVDDPTGGEAGPGEKFGDQPWPGPATPGGDPDPDSEEGRRQRPSPEGHTGPS